MHCAICYLPVPSPVSRSRCMTTTRPRRLAPVCGVKEVFMPALSSTMTEGKIVSWLKSEGEKISKGEPLVVVESDKADMDVESFNDGYLGKIVVGEGGVAAVGDAIAFLADTEAELAEAQDKEGASTNGTLPATEAKSDSAVSEEKTEKPEPVSVTSTTDTPAASPPPPPVSESRSDGRVIATPYAKKLAKELKVNLKNVVGSGPAGRITASDVEREASGILSERLGANGRPIEVVIGQVSTISMQSPSPVEAGTATDASTSVAQPVPVASSTPVSELLGTTVPFNALMQAVANGMVKSLSIPTFRVACSIETDAFDVLYKKLKPKGVTMTAMLAKACGIALIKHPLLFAQCTSGGDGVTYNEHINVAVAVAMEGGGLITPVLKDANSTDIYSMDWADLVKRARAKKLSPDEYNSGTFIISNLGMYGVDTFDAILPVGTAAILATGSSLPSVVATSDGMIGIKKIMKVSITCDHRIVYGAQAAEYLQTLKSVIEQPEQMTL